MPASNGGYWIEGGPGPDRTGVRAPQALFNVITPEYFRTLGVSLRRGRDFGDGDRAGAPRVAIVNESLARASFPNADPLGRRIQCGLDSLDFMTIVGVVADIRSSGPAQAPLPEIYMPYEQHAGYATRMALVARTNTADPMALTDAIRREITRRNPDVPVKASTMQMTLETASAAPRFDTFLLVVFAGVALVLALAGVYGVMAYTVSQRVPELGVRIALGATRDDILKLILGQGVRLAAAGVVIGIALALLGGRLLQGLLFGVTPRDPLILGAVVATVAIATVAACYLPARRAVGVDPVVALRAQ
jgi:predicted permease